MVADGPLQGSKIFFDIGQSSLSETAEHGSDCFDSHALDKISPMKVKVAVFKAGLQQTDRTALIVTGMRGFLRCGAKFVAL